ncbi:cartilage intermediate layer protein 2 isoform X2 [Rana temporaria]|uniref:cartilage intermediate layer protein 2 isoform X2 n=1 Tax=Rana temporaria TaxID=8407 RepID=UPI001AAD2839|nr:cartilage intermediate layer protein 2 isoform X2 [Rana temporaria]
MLACHFALLLSVLFTSALGATDWTSWFNVDHPGDDGDFETIEAIRFYYPHRLCLRPVAIEARTTEWATPKDTKEVVHTDPEKGFWCINKEQKKGYNCSNYHVRFQCPLDLLYWSHWTPWSTCSPTSCGGMGIQIRRRSCITVQPAVTLSLEKCLGEATERRVCVSSSCVGRWSSWGAWTPCTKTCGGGKSVRRRICSSKTAPCSGRTFQIQKCGRTLCREKPYMVQNPYSKIRRIGHKVTMCCEATGNPVPTKYYWYHNGTLLDKHTLKYDKSLTLRNIQATHGGIYQCKASNGVGVIRSSVAHLNVISKSESLCNKSPNEHLIKLPMDCFQNKTGSYYYNVGRCPNTQCMDHLSSNLQCKDEINYCCGVKQMKLQEVKCPGYILPVMVVVQCGCAECSRYKIMVRGRVTAYDTGEPLRFGQIFLSGENKGFTGYKGDFTLEVPEGTKRLVVTFVDRQEKFVETTKVIPFDPKGNTVYQDVKVMRKKDPTDLNPRVTNIISLGDLLGEDPIGEIIIPPNSFRRTSGEPYNSTVKASLTFLDPRNISSASAASSDLNFVSRDGDISPLRTYGMFHLDFREDSTNSLLQTGKVEVRLDVEQIKMPQHVKEMKLWSLNPQTGLWEEESHFRLPSGDKRKKREERSFLIGQLEIRERRLFNLDVPEFRRCFVKVRTFMNEKFMVNEQLEGIVVTLINLEPMPGFSSNPRAWGRFDSVVTGSNGACLPAFCDAVKPDAYSAYVTATMGGEELEAAPSSPKRNPNVIGVTQPYLSKLNYQRTDHDDSAGKKTAFKINLAKPNPNSLAENRGPIYAYRNLQGCEEASILDNHFRFFRAEEDKYEYNVVPFDETDLTSWIGSYLSWWPNPQEFRACYIKIGIQGPQEYMVRTRNIGGTHTHTVGQLYGLRDTRSVRDLEVESSSAACLEFKCSGMLFDQDLVDRTLVTVTPQGSCHVTKINRLLEEYLSRHPPLALGNNTETFNMLAPVDPLGHNYGIYTVTDQNPRLAKEIAIGRCFDGTSDGLSREMKSQVGIAVTFRCQEKPITRKSLFHRLLNNPGETLSEIRQNMQENEQRGTPARVVPYPALQSSSFSQSRKPSASQRRPRMAQSG